MTPLTIAKRFVNLPAEDRSWMVENISPEGVVTALAFSETQPEPQKFFAAVIKSIRELRNEPQDRRPTDRV